MTYYKVTVVIKVPAKDLMEAVSIARTRLHLDGINSEEFTINEAHELDYYGN